MEFHSDSTGSDASSQMEPVLQRLEEDLDTDITRINVFRRREFMTLLESIGFNECGNMPFYYNRRTGQGRLTANTPFPPLKLTIQHSLILTLTV